MVSVRGYVGSLPSLRESDVGFKVEQLRWDRGKMGVGGRGGVSVYSVEGCVSTEPCEESQ